VVCVWVGVQAAGFFGIFTSLLIWYIGVATLLNNENSYFTLPVGDLGRKNLD